MIEKSLTIRRWFTRVTLLAMFSEARLRLDAGVPRLFDEPQRELMLPSIHLMAKKKALHPEQAVRDALPLQYLLRRIWHERRCRTRPTLLEQTRRRRFLVVAPRRER